jgi:hypothetical protein
MSLEVANCETLGGTFGAGGLSPHDSVKIIDEKSCFQKQLGKILGVLLVHYQTANWGAFLEVTSNWFASRVCFACK